MSVCGVFHKEMQVYLEDGLWYLVLGLGKIYFSLFLEVSMKNVNNWYRVLLAIVRYSYLCASGHSPLFYCSPVKLGAYFN